LPKVWYRDRVGGRCGRRKLFPPAAIRVSGYWLALGAQFGQHGVHAASKISSRSGTGPGQGDQDTFGDVVPLNRADRTWHSAGNFAVLIYHIQRADW
jgi:hypothetical protein